MLLAKGKRRLNGKTGESSETPSLVCLEWDNIPIWFIGCADSLFVELSWLCGGNCIKPIHSRTRGASDSSRRDPSRNTSKRINMHCTTRDHPNPWMWKQTRKWERWNGSRMPGGFYERCTSERRGMEDNGHGWRAEWENDPLPSPRTRQRWGRENGGTPIIVLSGWILWSEEKEGT